MMPRGLAAKPCMKISVQDAGTLPFALLGGAFAAVAGCEIVDDLAHSTEERAVTDGGTGAAINRGDKIAPSSLCRRALTECGLGRRECFVMHGLLPSAVQHSPACEPSHGRRGGKHREITEIRRARA